MVGNATVHISYATSKKCWNARFDIEKLHDITFHCSKQEHYYILEICNKKFKEIK